MKKYTNKFYLWIFSSTFNIFSSKKIKKFLLNIFFSYVLIFHIFNMIIKHYIKKSILKEIKKKKTDLFLICIYND